MDWTSELTYTCDTHIQMLSNKGVNSVVIEPQEIMKLTLRAESITLIV